MKKDKDKKNIDNLFKAIKYLNKSIELLADSFDSEEITNLINKVNEIHEIRDKEDSKQL